MKLRCAYCNAEFNRSPSKARNSKSGIHFCSRAHKDLAQKIGGIKEIQPSHYGEELSKYRDKAFKAFENKCADCDYDKFIEILEVHHIDKNRSNNKLSNLVILCPNCHAIKHKELTDQRVVRPKTI